MKKWIIVFCLMAVTATASDKPNILFILTDDQGYGDLGRHGHPFLDTPNLDRLHDESVRFDNFYVSPSCSPTRASLMTGMHEFRNGVTHTLQPREHLFKEAVTLPQLLKTAGYKTGFVGKWHLGGSPGYAPCDRGFDWCSTNPKGPRSHFDVEIIRNNQRFQTKGFREDVFFDEAMTFIDEAGDQPWFMYLCTYSPHTPLDAPPDLIEKYRAEGLSDKHATYMAMIENIDMNYGRMEQFLKERGLEDNTVVIFMNDNGVTEGLDVYNAGMRGCKCTVWQGGTRAMSFWKWPDRWQPHTVESLTAHLDVLPTLCEIAGAEIPDAVQEELQGCSLVPLLNSRAWKHDDRLLFQHVGRWPSGLADSHQYAMCAVRKGHYLLVHSTDCGDPECEKYMSQCTTMRAVRNGLTTTTYTQGNAQFHWGVTPGDQWQLFNIADDPACQNDLSGKHPELKAELIAAYNRWWDEQFPIMMARGGDVGDPDASKNAASRARHHAAETAAKKVSDTVSQREIEMFARLDGDADGKVTKEEYLALFLPQFSGKDADGDGTLSAEEFPYAGSFRAGDGDGDGQLTEAEFKEMYSRQFDSRDANKDDMVTIDEM